VRNSSNSPASATCSKILRASAKFDEEAEGSLAEDFGLLRMWCNFDGHDVLVQAGVIGQYEGQIRK